MKASVLIAISFVIAGVMLIPTETYGQSASKNVSKDVLKVSISKPTRPSKKRYIESNSPKKKINAMSRYNRKHMVQCPTFASYTTKPRMQREKTMRKRHN